MAIRGDPIPAGAAPDRVDLAVAGGDHVVAATTVDDVAAASADDRVVPGAAVEPIASGTTVEPVVAGQRNWTPRGPGSKGFEPGPRAT
nr:hypothetical protein [Baekduia alba]